ncbi:MAG: NADPH:quinone reductase [Xanthomonadales bacterium]|nr:NADPH:quinone reductase [Xanthomonadales bacterium]
MKAAWFEQFGKAANVLQLGEQEKPTATAGEVLVRLQASGINPSDVKKRGGSSPGLLEQGWVIPHSDGAGIIEAVGEGVDASRIGKRVWVYQAQHGRRFGTAAEYVSIDQRRAAALPNAASMEQGACLGIPAMTAHRCVFADGPVDGLTILVTGGAGRVGHYAIQWAAKSGAKVIATASNDADAAACREAGAFAVVNHRDAEWAKQVLDANQGTRVDRVVEVDFGANLPMVLDLLRTGGSIATYASMTQAEPKLPFYRMMFKDITIHLVLVYEMPEAAKQQAMDDIEQWLAAGRLQHRVAKLLPLEKIVEAHQYIEQAAVRGCVVLSIS